MLQKLKLMYENIVFPLIELDFGDNFVLALEFRFRE